MPMATVDGGDIHYIERGSGAPVVMLLPQSGGPVGVEPFLDALAQSYRVITYDQRGTGRSAPVSASKVSEVIAPSSPEAQEVI